MCYMCRRTLKLYRYTMHDYKFTLRATMQLQTCDALFFKERKKIFFFFSIFSTINPKINALVFVNKDLIFGIITKTGYKN